jgi:dnd system-associated protein 4
MAPSRIRIAQDKADLVKALAASDSKTGLFSTYADVVLFAASLGIKRRKRSPLQSISKREPGPIAQDYFINRGHDVVIDLIAIGEVKDKDILSNGKPEVEAQRIQIFEEYANGGLEILQEELKGAIDYADRILLMMVGERFHTEESGQKSFDLSRFL